MNLRNIAILAIFCAAPNLRAAPINEPVNPSAAGSSRFLGVNEAYVGEAPLNLRILSGAMPIFRPGDNDLGLIYSHLAGDIRLNDYLALDAQLRVRSLTGNPFASMEDRAAVRLRYAPVSSHDSALGFGLYLGASYGAELKSDEPGRGVWDSTAGLLTGGELGSFYWALELGGRVGEEYITKTTDEDLHMGAIGALGLGYELIEDKLSISGEARAEVDPRDTDRGDLFASLGVETALSNTLNVRAAGSVRKLTSEKPAFGGLVAFSGPVGLTDRDDDGLDDAVDACPSTPGSPDFHGCPDIDTDSDGVYDLMDVCVEEAGPAENAGCPYEKADDGKAMVESDCPVPSAICAPQGGAADAVDQSGQGDTAGGDDTASEDQ